MALDRTASSRWEGNLKEGKGQVELESGAYSGSYTFASRFQQGSGTNPEEMIAGAHSACYAMALSSRLAKAGHDPEQVHATATVTLDPDQGRITRIHLEVRGRVPGIDEDAFLAAAEDAKRNCTISKLLTGADEITLDAALEQ